MAIQQEFWLKTVQEVLTKGFETVNQVAENDAAFINGTKIHIPNAGASATIKRGNTVYPAPITERVDTTVEYSLTSFQVAPTRLGWSDLLQLPHDKVQSVMKSKIGNLDEKIMNWALSQWWTHNSETTDRIVSTSHASATATNWLGGSATGTLKAMTGENVRQAAEILDKEKFPITDRYLLLDYKMFWQLVSDLSYNSARLEVVQGLRPTIPDVWGFKVIQIPYVAAVSANTGALTVIEPNSDDGSFTYSANNRPIGLAFHKSAVGYAFTPPKMFMTTASPEFYADVVSAEVYGGGKYRRTDGKGVVAIRATA
jgi:hypothetical protein